MRTTRFVAASVATLSAAVMPSAGWAREDIATSPAQITDFDATQVALSSLEHFPGLVAMTEGDKIIASFSQHEGAAQKKYDSFSISKLYTAIIAHRLDEEGILPLDVTLSQLNEKSPGVLPAPPAHLKDLTLRSLIEHTSRISSKPLLGVDPYDPDAVLKAIYARELEFHPSVALEYSNLAFSLYALIAEKVTAQSFADLIDKFVRTPAGIEKEKIPTTPKPTSYTAIGATGIEVSALELATVLAKLPQIVNPTSLDAIYSNPFWGAGYGASVGTFPDGSRIVGLHGSKRTQESFVIFRYGENRAGMLFSEPVPEADKLSRARLNCAATNALVSHVAGAKPLSEAGQIATLARFDRKRFANDDLEVIFVADEKKQRLTLYVTRDKNRSLLSIEDGMAANYAKLEREFNKAVKNYSAGDQDAFNSIATLPREQKALQQFFEKAVSVSSTFKVSVDYRGIDQLVHARVGEEVKSIRLVWHTLSGNFAIGLVTEKPPLQAPADLTGVLATNMEAIPVEGGFVVVGKRSQLPHVVATLGDDGILCMRSASATELLPEENR